MKQSHDAGEFNEWITGFIQAMKGTASGDVPCGECVGCCTSSKFILVRPTDTQARKAIPEELLFSVPGLPAGHHLLGYDKNGHCPMFKKGKCTIYTTRPETCRQYDCRVLAATGASTKDESLVIGNRVQAWDFSYSNNDSEKKAAAVILAMTFLRDNTELFPKEYLPPSESQRAALAIRIHEEFLGYNKESLKPNHSSFVSKIVKKYPVGS
jgi:Fe-S-cluster containining protein